MLDIGSVSYWLAVKVIVLQIITLGILILYLVPSAFPALSDFLRRYGLWIGFLVTLGAALTAHWFEWMGLVPCYLCWWGRILLYPQIVFFGVAAWQKWSGIAAVYSVILSVLGFLVSLYHHALQMGWVTSQPCAAAGSPDCAARIFFEFGYITFPLMNASLFAFLIVLMLFQFQRDRNID